MSVYLKKFETASEYEAYIASEDKVLPNVSFCEDERGIRYNPYVPPHDYSQDYFTMVVTVGGDVTWTGKSSNALSYSIDNGTTWSTASSSITLSVNEGDKVLWKGETTPSSSGLGKFGSNTNVRYSIEGNAMSLLFGDDFKGQTSLEGKDYAFYALFSGNINITSAENLSLPATTLAYGCYYAMFTYCTNLTTAPAVLPATTLASNCYRTMFSNCTSLTTAPELLATTLASYCCQEMFSSCTSLTTAPAVLLATTLAHGCYYQMFKGCTRLTTAPELPATTLADSCYNAMFSSCTRLTTAPELPATTLVNQCYSDMFKGCTSLTTAPSELPATTLATYCYSYMFNGCSRLTTAPELLATTLTNYCYSNMFSGCTRLTSITCLATNISASNCTKDWVKNVAASGTFTKAPSMSSWTRGTNGIPSGWDVQDAA